MKTKFIPHIKWKTTWTYIKINKSRKIWKKLSLKNEISFNNQIKDIKKKTLKSHISST